MILNYKIDPSNEGMDIKHILKNKLGISSRLIKKLKNSNKIYLNNTPARVVDSVKAGDVVSAQIDFDEDSDIIAEQMDFKILYEDDYLIAVDKTANIVVHPTCYHQSATLANGIKYYLLQKQQNPIVRPVIRLDKDTSGVILFAKNAYIQQKLIEQMKTGVFTKKYLGIVHGHFNNDQGTIDLPIARKQRSIMLREVNENGEKAVTHYKTIEKFKSASLVEFKLETGRTHQIRVHCLAMGNPLVGDKLYFIDDLIGLIEFNRQALHCHKIIFIHPATLNQIIIESALPEDITLLLEILRK